MTQEKHGVGWLSLEVDMNARSEMWLETMMSDAYHSGRLVIARTDTEARRLERLANEQVLVRPVRGMFWDPTEWQALKPPEKARLVVRTFAVKHPKWVFCNESAAHLHGLEVSDPSFTPVHIAVQRISTAKKTRNVIRHPMPDVDEVLVQGVKVTSLEQTVLYCLIEMNFDYALAVADSALRKTGLPRKHFVEFAQAHAQDIGYERALDVLAWANPLSENGGESVARAVMIEQGYAVPELQAEIADPFEAGRSYRCDYLWKLPTGEFVAGELDGRDKYRNPEMTAGRDAVDVLADERLRESRLGAAGLRVMRFSYADVQDVGRFTKIMDLYGIPRGPMRPRGRRL